MQIDQTRTRYIRWLLATRDLSPHTIRAYDSDLASFERYVGADFDVRQTRLQALASRLPTDRRLVVFAVACKISGSDALSSPMAATKSRHVLRS